MVNLEATRQSTLAIIGSEEEAPASKRSAASREGKGKGVNTASPNVGSLEKSRRNGEIHLPNVNQKLARGAPARGVINRMRLVLKSLMDSKSEGKISPKMLSGLRFFILLPRT